MEIKFTNYEYNGKSINIEISDKKIIGVTGKNKEEFISLITLEKLNKGQLEINDIKINKDNIRGYKKKIVFIPLLISTSQTNVMNIMIDYIKRHNLQIKDPIKKIADSLRIVELEEDILKRHLTTLSLSEKKKLQIAVALLSNPEVFILEEPFKCLDKQQEKKLYMLFQRIKEQFKKNIIIVSEESDTLYKYTNEMYFIKNDNLVLSGDTKEEYVKVDLLKKHKFSIPEIVEFTYLAKKKKNVKIDYHQDVRDIIKDIYKHV